MRQILDLVDPEDHADQGAPTRPHRDHTRKIAHDESHKKQQRVTTFEYIQSIDRTCREFYVFLCSLGIVSETRMNKIKHKTNILSAQPR